MENVKWKWKHIILSLYQSSYINYQTCQSAGMRLSQQSFSGVIAGVGRWLVSGLVNRRSCENPSTSWSGTAACDEHELPHFLDGETVAGLRVVEAHSRVCPLHWSWVAYHRQSSHCWLEKRRPEQERSPPEIVIVFYRVNHVKRSFLHCCVSYICIPI